MHVHLAKKSKPRLLFVDDEKRVLNSMRAMFRRDYELFLTTRGDEAIRIVNEHPIDVVVADQRMPIMTGVEVLSAVKRSSPGTVRILLTGYSDLDAIEGAMNDGEVFRFLSKPCAANELRGTISQAAAIARETGQVARLAADGDDANDTHEIAALSAEAVVPDLELALEVATGATARPAPRPAPGAAIPGDVVAAEPARRSVPPRPAPAPQAPAPQTQDRERDDAPRSGAAQPVVPPDRVRESVPLPGSGPAALRDLSGDEAPIEIVMSGDSFTVSDPEDTSTQPALRAADTAQPVPVLQPDARPPSLPTAPPATTTAATAPSQVPTLRPPSRVACVGKGKYKISIIAFTQDDQFARSIGRSLDGLFYTFHATNAVRLIEGVVNIGPAVVITDVSTEPEVIQSLTGLLKDKLPALVTMVAGRHRDADVMINLINHGQVFRFIDKPLSSAACQKHVREALRRHIQLRKNPELVQRYSVRENSGIAGTIARLGDRISGGLLRIRNLWGG